MWFDNLAGNLVGAVRYIGYCAIGTVAIASDTAVPVVEEAGRAVGDLLLEGLNQVETAAVFLTKAEVSFLIHYPGIAQLLSQQTVIKMAVAEHVGKAMAGDKSVNNAQNISSVQ